MQIKQSFLNSLEGLFKDQAEALVESESLTASSLPNGTIIPFMAYPNTVHLWLDESNVVELATAGDPLQVVDDT